ncbi:WD repeat-containing protein 44-like isoform X1 [Mangifera indica]|uniref:WD repeat-containing protein 44-like isoform X1 n=1 Tax=Mangifera indica TaxID=29780 RepID=UPI001CFA53EE|nr:WD repeat-containing protein 44-like isoform X1 [Mangifera indica]
MSKTGGGGGDEEDEDECFYESLDRLVTSSNSCSTSSSSSSDSEPDNLNINPESPVYDFCVPKFPMGVSNKYDVWISEPVSVSERRTRLLREMGLSHDPALSRAKSGPERQTGRGDFESSASSGGLTQQDQGSSVSGVGSVGIVRSKSDGSRNSKGSDDDHRHQLSNFSPSILSIHSSSVDSPPVNNNLNSTDNDDGNVIQSVVVSKSLSVKSNNEVVASATLSNKPPTGKNCKRVEENRLDSLRLLHGYGNGNYSSNSLPLNANGGEVVEHLDSNGIVAADKQVCLIRNLDNGKEFVVNEIREDGMWNKVKEVGTGRQLTMEEFEMSVGHSPLVQELMRRQNVEEGNKDNFDLAMSGNCAGGGKLKKKGSWLKSIRTVASTVTGHKEKRSSDERDRDTSSEKGGRRSSSATDDSQDVSFHGPERVRVRQYGKSCKELTALYKSQEIQAHNGSIWSIKFSLDGRYLASAGEDCVIHVWQVVESERKGELLEKPEEGNLNLLLLANGSPDPNSLSPKHVDDLLEKKRRGRPMSRKSLSMDHIVVPETVFGLSEKPICSFQGHLDDVLDLSWSKSQHLLSSSMDKTVRLWHLLSKTCLRIFSHSDYVTCIQFNPVDDRYFISGSLDAKVRIWSIPDRQVVDWNDLHEMVTAACYTPDGQGALVGSCKGSCHLYDTSDNKLQEKSPINLQSKKKSQQKKVTGFQFAPGSSSEVLITSADSRVRVVDGVDLVHKFKGFRNTNSQICASFTANGRYVVSASEDSYVYVWKHEAESRFSRKKGVTVTHSYEHFHCQDVSVAVPWPGMGDLCGLQDTYSGDQSGVDNNFDEFSMANHPPTPVEEINSIEGSQSASGCTNSPLNGTISSATDSYFFDRISATWPEERLYLAARNRSPRASVDFANGLSSNMSAWGMVVVTATLRGEIRTFQNFGLPVRL